MPSQDHLKTCSDCKEKYSQLRKPTVWIKTASSYHREKKLAELGALIKGVSYPGISYVSAGVKTRTNTKGASSQLELQFKLKELARLITGV